MNLLATAARILYALPFAWFGVNHFIHGRMMPGMVPSFFPAWSRLPLVYFVGAAMIAACIAIIAGIQIRLACFLLSLLLAIFVFTIHLPGVLHEATRQMQLTQLLKDFCLSAAALYIGATSKGS